MNTREIKQKIIIENMIRQYNQVVVKKHTSLHFILSQYLDEETIDEINTRVDEVKK